MILALLLVAAVLIRLPATLHATFYTSDTAILDLMALHFLKGHFTFYYWGETYYGVLDPILLMPLIKIWGCHPWVSQLLPLTVTPVFLTLYYLYLRRITSRFASVLATAWLAIPTPYFFRFTFGTYNYIFGLIFGMAHFLLAQRLFVEKERNPRLLVGLGLLAGFSWYYFRFILFFWGAIALSLWWNTRGLADLKRLRLWWQSASWRKHTGHIVGLKGITLPIGWRGVLIVINAVNVINTLLALFLWLHGNWEGSIDGITVKLFFWATAKISIELALVVYFIICRQRLMAYALRACANIDVRRFIVAFIIGYSPAIIASWMGHAPGSPGKVVALPLVIGNLRVMAHDIFPLMLMYGSSWTIHWLTTFIGLVGLAVIVWLSHWRSSVPFIAALVIVNFGMCATCNQLIDVSSGRYLLPLYLGLPVGLAWFLQRLPGPGKLALGVLVVLCLVQSVETAYQSASGRDIDRYERLADYLINQGIQGGYADYWLAYKMTAIAGERVRFAVAGTNDRYTPYRDFVKSLPRLVVLNDPGIGSRSAVQWEGQEYHVLRQELRDGFTVVYLGRA